VRCDFNVPIDEKGNILDDFKIKQTLPTIKYLIDNKAKIILISHLGNPNGRIVPELKMDKVAERLSECLKFFVAKADDCIGPEIESSINALKPGGVLLLENLDFHEKEIVGDLGFAEQLSWLCEIYINDAFSECHKISASVTGIPQYLQSGAGLLLEKEINNLNKILQNGPEGAPKPVAAIIGGKIEEAKLKLVDRISDIADWVMISGLIKEELIRKEMLFKHQDKIIGPVDFIGRLDIDEKTIKIFQEKIMQAKTILWYGSLGKFEEKQYAKGTLAIAKAIIESGAFSIIGGGETIKFLIKKGLISKFSHVSAGGEAMLQYLNGDKLPGLSVLK